MFILLAIYFQILKYIKNNINNLNRITIENEYFKIFIKVKNILNKGANIIHNLLTGFSLFIAFLGFVSLVF